MPDLKKALKTVTEKAKKVVYPDKETLRREWDKKKREDKLRDNRNI